VVMTSHDLERAASLAMRVDILSRGVVVHSLEAGGGAARLREVYQSVVHG